MRKNDVFGYAFMQGVSHDVVPQDKYQLEIDDKYQSSDSDPNRSLLSVVYAISEKTKLPTGDLSYLVNSKANPEIKKFVLDNIMMDVSSAARPAVPDGMSDDLALELARKDGESLEDYSLRLNTEVDKFKWLQNELQKPVVSTGADPDLSSE